MGHSRHLLDYILHTPRRYRHSLRSIPQKQHTHIHAGPNISSYCPCLLCLPPPTRPYRLWRDAHTHHSVLCSILATAITQDRSGTHSSGTTSSLQRTLCSSTTSTSHGVSRTRVPGGLRHVLSIGRNTQPYRIPIRHRVQRRGVALLLQVNIRRFLVDSSGTCLSFAYIPTYPSHFLNAPLSSPAPQY